MTLSRSSMPHSYRSGVYPSLDIIILRYLPSKRINILEKEKENFIFRFPKIMKSLTPENQAFINLSRWPPLWWGKFFKIFIILNSVTICRYMKDYEFYERFSSSLASEQCWNSSQRARDHRKRTARPTATCAAPSRECVIRAAAVPALLDQVSDLPRGLRSKTVCVNLNVNFLGSPM